MKINRNMSAVVANRQLLRTENKLSLSMGRLSSGYKINKAGDNPAGMAISSKMKAQIDGLDQAEANSDDGQSVLRIADGALNEVSNMLQRIRELSVQAANGTNSYSDRQSIQDEIDQLATEIDRVSETTKFNEIYLLKGDTKTASKANFMKSTYVMAKDLYAKGGTAVLTADQLKEELAKGNRVYTVAEANAGDQTDANIAEAGKDYVYATKLYDAKGKEVSAEQIADSKNADGSTATNYYVNDKGAVANAIAITAADAKAKNIQPFDVNGELSFNLHVGADSAADNKIAVKIESMSAAGIGVKDLKVDTEDDATAAIDRIAEAVAKVSSQRSALGAVQNRLEHTIDNLDNVVENTTAAESRIRDTDMAEEMVNYSKNNILAQAGQSMLAQANQSTQGVLSLLQ